MVARLRQLLADPAFGYLARALGWFLVLLGALRLPLAQSRVLIPFARLQGDVAAALRGEELRVLIDTSCTGSDAVAVCLGAVLAFPVAWRKRLLAAAGGFLVITAVNTVRIGHLSGLVEHPERLNLFHLRIWPAVIILVAAGYGFLWMRWVSTPTKAPSAPTLADARWRLPAVPFLALATVLVALYFATYDRLLASPLLGAEAHGAAATAGALMRLFGADARVSGGVLNTSGAAWLVTPECVTTPLIPLFIAAVLTVRIAWWVRLALLAATPVLFFVLGVGRLMVVALPPMLVGSPAIAVHAFYQFLVAGLLVAWLAKGSPRAGRRAVRALALGAAAGLAIGLADLKALRPAFEQATAGLHLGHGFVDAQGALLLLPAFMLGLLVAVWNVRKRPGGWRGLGTAAAILAAAAALVLLLVGEFSTHSGPRLPVVLLRAFSLALPALVAWVLGWARLRPSPPPDAFPAGA